MQGMDYAKLCSLAGRYVNRILTRFLAPIDCSKTEAQYTQSTASEPEFLNLLRSPGIDSQHGGPVRQLYLTHRPARLHRLAESVPCNRFLGSLNGYKFGLTSVVKYTKNGIL